MFKRIIFLVTLLGSLSMAVQDDEVVFTSASIDKIQNHYSAKVIVKGAYVNQSKYWIGLVKSDVENPRLSNLIAWAYPTVKWGGKQPLKIIKPNLLLAGENYKAVLFKRHSYTNVGKALQVKVRNVVEAKQIFISATIYEKNGKYIPSLRIKQQYTDKSKYWVGLINANVNVKNYNLSNLIAWAYPKRGEVGIDLKVIKPLILPGANYKCILFKRHSYEQVGEKINCKIEDPVFFQVDAVPVGNIVVPRVLLYPQYIDKSKYWIGYFENNGQFPNRANLLAWAYPTVEWGEGYQLFKIIRPKFFVAPGKNYRAILFKRHSYEQVGAQALAYGGGVIDE